MKLAVKQMCQAAVKLERFTDDPECCVEHTLKTISCFSLQCTLETALKCLCQSLLNLVVFAVLVCASNAQHSRLCYIAGFHEALIRPGPDLVVCDEGHRIKNCGASTSRALKNIQTRQVLTYSLFLLAVFYLLLNVVYLSK